MCKHLSYDYNMFITFSGCHSLRYIEYNFFRRSSQILYRELQVGKDNIEKFKSNGKCVYELPGVYYISSHIYTKTQGTSFFVKKNRVTIIGSVSDSTSTYSTNPISAVVDLQLNDMLYVYASLYIHPGYSCLSIMKTG